MSVAPSRDEEDHAPPIEQHERAIRAETPKVEEALPRAASRTSTHSWASSSSGTAASATSRRSARARKATGARERSSRSPASGEAMPVAVWMREPVTTTSCFGSSEEEDATSEAEVCSVCVTGPATSAAEPRRCAGPSELRTGRSRGRAQLGRVSRSRSCGNRLRDSPKRVPEAALSSACRRRVTCRPEGRPGGLALADHPLCSSLSRGDLEAPVSSAKRLSERRVSGSRGMPSAHSAIGLRQSGAPRRRPPERGTGTATPPR